MANYLDFVSIQVRNLERSKLFYHDLLGLKFEPDPPPHAVVFDRGKGATFTIRKPLIDLDSVTSLGAGVALWFTTPDIEALHQNLMAASVKILQKPQPFQFGKMMMVVTDPDGYTITIYQP
jgi:predicted enzyme related to lactoylglutathione lyase